MHILSYEDFREYCRTNIVKILGGSEFYTAESIVLPLSDDEQVDSVVIKKKGQTSGMLQSFRVRYYYEKHLSGIPLGEIMLEILKSWEDADFTSWPVNMELISSFDSARDRLILRPLNYSTNKKLLEDCVYKRVGNVAIVLYLIAKEENGGRHIARICRDIVSGWGVSEDMVMECAMENTMSKSPPIVLPFELAMQLGVQGDGMFKSVPDKNKIFMNPLVRFQLIPSQRYTYYLGVLDGFYGAISAFYPKVLDNLCRIFNDDLYVMISSASECVLHLASSIGISEAKNFVKIAARNSQRFEDSSDQIDAAMYSYKREKRILTKL